VMASAIVSLFAAPLPPPLALEPPAVNALVANVPVEDEPGLDFKPRNGVNASELSELLHSGWGHKLGNLIITLASFVLNCLLVTARSSPVPADAAMLLSVLGSLMAKISLYRACPVLSACLSSSPSQHILMWPGRVSHTVRCSG